jgi:SagB-type dehydrogenase family enzyme
MSDTPQNESDEPSFLNAYHLRSKHRFEAYAEGPGQLDWDAQPAPFRHYPGAPVLELPLCADRYERPFGELACPPSPAIFPDPESLGALLELSFGISAWKHWGDSRWALRCNPSSGNLHPTDAYVLCSGLPDVPAGLHHYDAENHALEHRAACSPQGAPWLAIGLSSVMWREAWKYGERAFRYCQLDIGHALGALGYAAALLGWTIAPLPISHGSLAHLLGLDRSEDFPQTRLAFTEAEEPEVLIGIQAPTLTSPPAPDVLAAWLTEACWQGKPSAVDPSPGYRWPIIDKAAIASRSPDPERLPAAKAPLASFPPIPSLAFHPTAEGAARLIRQRRSGQRFDPRSTLPKPDFYRILDAVLPRQQPPFLAQEAAPAIHLLIFVMRVEGVPSGLYLLSRFPSDSAPWPTILGMDDAFREIRPMRELDPDCPPHLDLAQLTALSLREVQVLARSLSCHQDIASCSAFSLGMLGHIPDMRGDGYAYRRLLREAGLIGQVLYLEAEAAGVRGTGIGCFFDDPVHKGFGIANRDWQSIYHFTIGTPVIDSRIETSPPYPHRQQVKP